VNSTWLRRCDTQLFMSSKAFPGDSRVINIVSEEGRNKLPFKTFKAFKYAFDNYLNESDWFMKADDDTYVFVENLKHALSAFDPNEPVYLGHHFRPHIRQGYNSGGAGYVLSREALRRFGTTGYGQSSAKCTIESTDEDVELGRCMERLGVRLASTLDETGRSRFHGYQPSSHIGGKPVAGYDVYDASGGKTGPDTISDFAVTFHYVTPEEMQILEYFAYRFRLFGERIAVEPSGSAAH
jgi:glycoprotein-N-acetylgalactosamine 3-beta-galactosyltransferase